MSFKKLSGKHFIYQLSIHDMAVWVLSLWTAAKVTCPMSTITVPQACCHSGHVSPASPTTTDPCMSLPFCLLQRATELEPHCIPPFQFPFFTCLLWLHSLLLGLPTDTPLPEAVACPLIPCGTCCLHLVLGSSEHSCWICLDSLVLFFQSHGNLYLDIPFVTSLWLWWLLCSICSLHSGRCKEGFPCSPKCASASRVQPRCLPYSRCPSPGHHLAPGGCKLYKKKASKHNIQ